MTPIELKMLRQLLCLTSAEAGIHIAESNAEKPARFWQRLEDGSRSIKTYIVDVVQQLTLMREERLLVDFNEDDPNYKWFSSLDEFIQAGGPDSVLKWRLAQSVATALAAEKHAQLWRNEELIDEKSI